jgi:AcrR family transcriptional regulator
MKMSGSRSQQRVVTRERILATARQLFLNASFDQVGVRDIAAEAGVATGTVIAAYGSKGDLLNAIMVQDLQRQLPLMKAAAAGFETTFDRMSALCGACVVYQTNQLAIVRACMADAWTRSDAAENRVRDAIKPLIAVLVEELERGVARREISDGANLKLAALMIFETVLYSYRIPLYSDQSRRDLEPIVNERLRFLFAAIGGPAHAQQAKQPLATLDDVMA